jgi:hypothetical protein
MEYQRSPEAQANGPAPVNEFLSSNLFEHVVLFLTVYKFKPKGRSFIFKLFEQLIFSEKIEEKCLYLL